ncbi:peptide chain release factor-like protein [soil metagenome]
MPTPSIPNDRPTPAEPASVHPAAIAPDRLLASCEVKFARRSGPGGQNRNKVETAVILSHPPSGLSAEANERRQQGQNKEVALGRLRVVLALGIRCAVEAASSPSPLWRSRCRGGRISINPTHNDFPALLAEALDVLADRDWDIRSASDVLGCSTSQLTKFLKNEPRALRLLNDQREGQGLRPLL